MIDLHLLWEVFLKHRFLVCTVENELYRYLSLDFNRRFAVFGIVEPSLGPPSESGLVGVDSKQSRYIKTLYFNIEILEWVYYSG